MSSNFASRCAARAWWNRRVTSRLSHLPEVPGERERLSPTPRAVGEGFSCDFSQHASDCDVWSGEGCSGEPDCAPAITRTPAVEIEEGE